ncbi:hypothetical protein [Burkholderia sp. NLJ2]|uniref:hypothetical protein n=1 Tax=Burkholderia sp. NLJ2 TaxID=3090699 RepID=UPI003C6BFB15
MNTTGRTRSHDLRHRAILSAGPGRRRRTILVLLVVLVGYAAADLFWPLHRDLSRFDPIATGTLETKIWRSYYERQHVALFLELAQTLRTQYHLPWLRSYVGAYYGASAAFTFKEGKERSDYEKALPALHTYFSLIRNTGNRDFNLSRTTALELEWWIVHRQRGRYPPGALGSACAEAAASLYRVSAVSTREHGQLRAQAMLLRDAREDAGSVTDADWATIESLLHRSYLSLGHAVSSTNAVAGAR